MQSEATMKTVVVYESMYGNTHVVAERIAEGMRTKSDVQVVPVSEATVQLIQGADLLVVGGPTHVHSMSSDRSRAAAEQAASTPGSLLTMDKSANGIGLRKWLRQLPDGDGRSATAFDTRMTGSPLVTGRASRAIAKQLARHGFDLFADPESFLVDHDNHLVAGAANRAYGWGRLLAMALEDDVALEVKEPGK